MIYIYTLSHPITNEVRYVGKTINIKRRYKQHLYDKRGTHKASWVKSLRKDGLKPILNILEECTDNWQEREIHWISQYDNLTNHSIGGGGVDYSRTTSEETREKMRQAQLGKTLTEEHKRKIGSSVSKKNLGNPKLKYTKSNDHKEKLSNACTTKKIIIIDDIQYPSVTNAAKLLGISWEALYSRLKSKNYLTYYYK